ncbi:Alpha/Beta hydrolase protein [Pisolithus albus]|nr:Alpha/Beta hydrolase protein [Pisolithus albus]
MSNPLTRRAGLQLGPVVLGTLVHHYFGKLAKKNGKVYTQLMQDELLYDQAFNIIKRFLEISTYHSVEQVQAFANHRTAAPPSVHVVRLLVPVSCCDEAAAYLIEALGGEDHAKRIVGGTKWWQVRGIPGIDAEWITSKKDLQQGKKHRSQSKENGAACPSAPPTNDATAGPQTSNPEANSTYHRDMDELRCILYAHGGGYFFGSVDQERYSIQRHARKINGRVFAINYRLAPQYPFPCALHDILAAYLYLIRPPPGAPHKPVNPAHIVVVGDSAGGGLLLALLQVLRDTKLPMPAGGVLISPWCDLTHSFPSVHTNTDTDIIPPYGLSLQKPSLLWPPPSHEVTSKVHSRLRKRIHQMILLHTDSDKAEDCTSPVDPLRRSMADSIASLDEHEEDKPSGMPVNVGATAPLPSVDKREDQTIRLHTKSGETLTVDCQVHLYTQNSLLQHPLVSPALSYLGGLPPLMVIAGDKEVLRDEIIYSAHKAAKPSQYPVHDAARDLYPPLVGIESRHRPTPVHLQVYDDAPHVLPVYFGFTTPAKYCYRAMANFIKHVTGITTPTELSSPNPVTSPSQSVLLTPEYEERVEDASNLHFLSALSANGVDDRGDDPSLRPDPTMSSMSPVGSRPSRVEFLSSPASPSGLMTSLGNLNSGKRISFFESRSTSGASPSGVSHAGEASAYCDQAGHLWNEGIIRERVSTQGEIRPLEPKEQLDAFSVPSNMIGVLSERTLRRYIDGKALFDNRFKKEMAATEKQRRRNMDLAKKEFSKVILHLRELRDGKDKVKAFTLDPSDGSWGWAWALDEDEKPPPSCIVARHDTDEARRLARIADQAFLQDSVRLSGNNLWSTFMNLISSGPETNHIHSVSETRTLAVTGHRPRANL